MKKSVYILLFVSFLVPLHCSEKSLDLAPIGQLSTETYYNKEADFTGALFGAYAALTNLYFAQDGTGYVMMYHLPDDDMVNGSPNNLFEANVNNFNWLPSENSFQRVFQTAYKGIFRANVILEQLPEADQFEDEANKVGIEAEAKFLWAYYNFLLWTGWNNAPIVEQPITEIEALKVPNSQEGELVDLIVSDLRTAEGGLPLTWDESNLGRATSGTAKALLGKVYLYQQRYQEAADKLQEVISSGAYSLMPDYGDNFSLDAENNQESVFEIQFSHEPFANSWLATDFDLAGNNQVGYHASGRSRAYAIGAPTPSGEGVPVPGGGQNRYHGSQALLNEFEPGDARLAHTMYVLGDTVAGTDIAYDPAWSWGAGNIAKYERNNSIITGDYNGGQQFADVNNERIIRYADVLLMRAEALLQLGDAAGATALINQVRERAGLAPLADNATFNDLMHERRVELALEGHRYNDLVRWHKAGLINVGDIPYFSERGWTDKFLLRPYPQQELDVNENLRQNPQF